MTPNDTLTPQVDKSGHLHHLLRIQGLDREMLLDLLDNARTYLDRNLKLKRSTALKEKTVLNLFFEPSTRTRCSFELAARRLAADVINFNMSLSSLSKGESLQDTVSTLEAMQVDLFVVRHTTEGIAEQIASTINPKISVINAGDGRNEHPTQALLDAMTIRYHKPNINDLRVAIVGDVLNSRVARSEIHVLQTLGISEIRVIGPDSLLPKNISDMGVEVFHNIEQGLKDVDVVFVLRLQRERVREEHMPSSQEYYDQFGVTSKRLSLAKPDAIVMHPGPMNRGVEIESSVADGPQSVILQQVTFGVAIRMAVMATLLP